MLGLGLAMWSGLGFDSGLLCVFLLQTASSAQHFTYCTDPRSAWLWSVPAAVHFVHCSPGQFVGWHQPYNEFVSKHVGWRKIFVSWPTNRHYLVQFFFCEAVSDGQLFSDVLLSANKIFVALICWQVFFCVSRQISPTKTPVSGQSVNSL